MKNYLSSIRVLSAKLEEVKRCTESNNAYLNVYVTHKNFVYLSVAQDMLALVKRIRANDDETSANRQTCAAFILNELMPSNECLQSFRTYFQNTLDNAQQAHDKEYQSSGSYILGFRFSQEEIDADYHLGETQSLSDTIEYRFKRFEKDIDAAATLLDAVKKMQQEREQNRKLTIFNTLKQYAYGLDGLFKATGQSGVKFHQVSAAVFCTALDILNTKNLDLLRTIFGDVVNEPEALEAMHTFISDVVAGIKTASDDQALNNVMNNYRYVDQAGRFPSYIIDEPSSFQFKGRLVINHSYQKKETFDVGDIVNVVLTLDRTDAGQLVSTLREQLEGLGLEVGRLTSTTDTAERHVSLALRIPYTDELCELVKCLNETVIPALTLETAAKLQVVTPMDIRTSRSAISLVSDTTSKSLHSIQQQVYQAAGREGNQLPRLHITHGNSPVQPAVFSKIAQLHEVAPSIDEALSSYGLNLADALDKHHEQTRVKIACSMWKSETDDEEQVVADTNAAKRTSSLK